MGVRVLDHDGLAVLYDSTSDIAFGPVFRGQFDAREQALHFLDWLSNDPVYGDPRRVSHHRLMAEYKKWCDEFTNEEGELTAEAMSHAVTLT